MTQETLKGFKSDLLIDCFKAHSLKYDFAGFGFMVKDKDEKENYVVEWHRLNGVHVNYTRSNIAIDTKFYGLPDLLDTYDSLSIVSAMLEENILLIAVLKNQIDYVVVTLTLEDIKNLRTITERTDYVEEILT